MTRCITHCKCWDCLKFVADQKAIKYKKTKFTSLEWVYTNSKENLFDLTKAEIIWYKLIINQVSANLTGLI